jgi:hypothetical protein
MTLEQNFRGELDKSQSNTSTLELQFHEVFEAIVIFLMYLFCNFKTT